MRIAPPRSLLGQFVLLNIATALIAVVVVSLTVSVLLRGTATHYQRKLLLSQSALIAAKLNAAGRARPVLNSDMLADGMAVVEIDRTRAVHIAAGPDRPAIIAEAPLDTSSHFFTSGAVEGYSLPRGDDWIVVSQDTGAPEVVTDDIVRTFLERFALLVLPIAAFGPLIGALLTWRLTRQMKTVSAIAATVGPRALDIRLPLGKLPLEVEPLAISTNKALDRLAEGFRTQAAFAADVAHELRTPLAVLRLRADAVADRETRQGVLESVDRIARVVTQVLALADLERRIEDAGETVDLRTLAETVVAERAPAIMAGGRSISFEDAGGHVAISGYPVPIALALENLIDNAARHTPPGSAITVIVGPGAKLAVRDDGPGVSSEHLIRMKQRFWRLDGSRVEGSGIGLSLVQRIADAHGGALDIANEVRGHGLYVTLHLSEGG